jgi:hypothetical protein
VTLTPEQFAAALLRRLGAPVTRPNVRGVVGWEAAEGGHWHNTARHNPLNTTQPMRGAGNTGSQGNIKVYRNWRQGLRATVKTLRNGRYQGILDALQHSDPNALASAVGSSPWGTSGSLVAQTIAGTRAPGHLPAVPKRLGGGGGGGQAGAGLDAGGQSSGRRDLGQPGSTLALLQALSQSQQSQAPMASGGVALPAFAAHPALPTAYQGLSSSGGQQAAKPDISGLMAAIQTQGGLNGSSGGSGQQQDGGGLGNGAQGRTMSPGDVTAWAHRKLGHYKETGWNTGPELDLLENRFGMRGQAWCAMFATVAASKGGAPKAIRTPAVAEIRRRAQAQSSGYQGLYSTSKAQSGDLFGIEKNGVSHVGFVDFVDRQGRIHTIEGNTSSGKVVRVIRTPGEGSWVARPKYRR